MNSYEFDPSAIDDFADPDEELYYRAVHNLSLTGPIDPPTSDKTATAARVEETPYRTGIAAALARADAEAFDETPLILYQPLDELLASLPEPTDDYLPDPDYGVLEQSIIDLVLDKPDLIGPHNIKLLRPDHFREHAHRCIIVAWLELYSEYGQAPTRLLVRNQICRYKPDEVEGVIEAAKLCDRPHSTPLEREVARKHLGQWMKRQIMRELHTEEALMILRNCGPEAFASWVREVVDKANMVGAVEEQTKFSFRELHDKYPDLRPAVIDGLLRESEVGNLISYSKFGKSWMVYGLALSVASGKPWFGRFKTDRGRVLIVDNELHRETLSYRIAKVAEAMGLRPDDYMDRLEVWALRGANETITTLRDDFMQIEPYEYKLIILDAKYRFSDAKDENANAEDRNFYNILNEYGERTRAAWILIHHATKGDQSEKRVTDVGAGAGVQSRACDSHIILRELEADGVAMDTALRSFPPLERIGIRWEFPLWKADETLDVTKLATKQNKDQVERDKQGAEMLLEVLQKLPAGEWISSGVLAAQAGMGHSRADRLCYQLPEVECMATRPNNKGLQYRLLPSAGVCRQTNGREPADGSGSAGRP